MMYPKLLDSGLISDDAKERTKLMRSHMSSPIGAYTSDSRGHNFVRKSVAEFIEKRDGPAVQADFNNIYLTNGASEGVR